MNNTAQLGRTLLNDRQIHIKTDIHSGTIFVYTEQGYYDSVCAEAILKRYIKTMLGDDFSIYKMNEIISWIKLETQVDINEIMDYEYISVKNGLLNINTMELKEHTPDIMTKLYLDITYEKSIGTDKVNDFVKDVVGEKNFLTVQECFGNILAFNHYITKKILYLHGSNDSGKSTLINCIQALIGKKNYSNLSIHQLEEKFTNANIYNKTANFCSDVPYRLAPKYYSAVKNFTGGDTVTLQFKHKNAFEYESNAKMFFTANGILSINFDAVDDAYYRRWQFVYCPNRFKKDSTIFSSYTTDQVKSAWLNWLLEGYQRLKNNSWNLTNEMSVEQAKSLFIEGQVKNKTVIQWLTTCCEKTTDDYELIETLFRECRDWHEQKKLTFPIVNVQNFGEFMNDTQQIFDIAVVQITTDGKRKRAYKGIKLIRPAAPVTKNKEDAEEETAKSDNIFDDFGV